MAKQPAGMLGSALGDVHDHLIKPRPKIQIHNGAAVYLKNVLSRTGTGDVFTLEQTKLVYKEI